MLCCSKTLDPSFTGLGKKRLYFFLAQTNFQLATKKGRLRETETPFKLFFVENTKCKALVVALLDSHWEKDSEKFAEIRFLSDYQLWNLNSLIWL